MNTTLTPAPLLRRMAALVYEGLLMAAVTAVAGLVAGIVATVMHPVPLLARIMVSLIIIAAWWWYCRINWHKKGQTLAMKVWRIRLVSRQGQPAPLPQLRLRFMWACLFVILVPALAYLAFRSSGIAPKPAAATALFWWILPWGFALLNPQRQFLYDYLAGTVLADVPKASTVHQQT